MEGYQALCYLWNRTTSSPSPKPFLQVADSMKNRKLFNVWLAEYLDLGLIYFIGRGKDKKIAPTKLGVETILGLIEDNLV